MSRLVDNWQKFALRAVVSAWLGILPLFAESTHSYTNHAGGVVKGTVLTVEGETVLIRTFPAREKLSLPLSIFPEMEQRRIYAQAGQPLLPRKVQNAYEGYRKRVSRSLNRGRAGLCTREDTRRCVSFATEAFSRYLDAQLRSGVLLPEEAAFLRSELVILSERKGKDNH